MARRLTPRPQSRWAPEPWPHPPNRHNHNLDWTKDTRFWISTNLIKSRAHGSAYLLPLLKIRVEPQQRLRNNLGRFTVIDARKHDREEFFLKLRSQPV